MIFFNNDIDDDNIENDDKNDNRNVNNIKRYNDDNNKCTIYKQ